MLKVIYKQCTYIPAVLAARTPAGASSKTRIFIGSTGPPYQFTNNNML